MYDSDTEEFIKEREEKLGAKILFRSYATWFSEMGGEKREYGVFLYSDGKTLVIEDFFRPSSILGYELNTKNEKERRKEYQKLEISLDVNKIEQISLVSFSSAEASWKSGKDCRKPSNLFNKIFTKNVTSFKHEGRIFFFELPSFKEFFNTIERYKENNKK